MSRPTSTRPAGLARLAVLIAALGLALAFAGLLPGASDTRQAQAQDGVAPPFVVPQLGPLQGAQLIGSSPQGTSGDPAEAWAVRMLSTLPPAIDGTPLAFGQGTDPQLTFMRYTNAEGWRVVETPLDEQGQPYRGTRAPSIARVTPRGGLAAVLDDPSRPDAQRRVVLIRDRGGRSRIAPTPGADVLRPASGSTPAEQVSATALSVRDAGDATELFAPIVGPTRQTGVAHWGGGGWSRETICVADPLDVPPPGCAADETLSGSGSIFTVLGVAADDDGGAWLLARAQPEARLGLVLFRRVTSGAGPRWALQDGAVPPFLAADAAPARGIDSVSVPDSPDALTATAAGVWIDAHVDQRGVGRDVTVFTDGQHATSWCDAAADAQGALCDHPLGFGFAPRHRSFAWAGDGFGTRVVGPVTDPAHGGSTAVDRYATLEGATFVTHLGFNGRRDVPLAFAAPDEGWIGSSHVTREEPPTTLARWPVPVRRPITAIAGQPDRTPGDVGAGALAVGLDGTILRYTPGAGWDGEALLGAGGVARPNLRGVAWPTPECAYAVGDDGAMWRWRSVTNLWEADPAAPFDFVGSLTGIAFQPGNPQRGYVVGRAGVLMAYGKTWQQQALPPEVQRSGPLGGPADLMSVAFAGSQGLVAAGRSLLVDDGGGWRVDPGAQALIDQVPGASVIAVAGLADGGAVAAGRNLVIERDGPSAPWRPSDQPLPDLTVTAVAAVRDGGRVHALATVGGDWPVGTEVQPPPTDPGSPPPRLVSFTPPADGTLLRETPTGWRDQQQDDFGSPTADAARKPDPLLALLVDASGRGWVVGGFSGLGDRRARGVQFGQDGSRLQTAAVERYDPAGPQGPPGLSATPPATPAGRIRLAVGGNAACLGPCADLAPLQTMPDQTLSRALQQAGAMAGQPGGPRALLYTGGRTPAPGGGRQPQDLADEQRLASLLGSAPGLPVFGAVAADDSSGGTTDAFGAAFAGFPAPFGGGPLPPGMRLVTLGAQPTPGRARTHYAVDSTGLDGTVRIVVIDNSSGSLAASDPHQNPAEPQQPWLRAVLADAKAHAIPAIVMGSRSLAERATSNGATDAAEIAAVLRDGGASAYVFDWPGEQRALAIPVGSGEVPSFGSGSLGYPGNTSLDTGYRTPALLLLELDAAHRDARTNRAPVSVRLVPVIEDLALDALDGRLLNRSQPALFAGLGRRPRSGDDWRSFGGNGSDPYVQLPAPACAGGCAGRIDPEVRFTSSDPDIADFVRLDPQSTNPRKPYIDPRTDKVVADSTSDLLCAFNAGTTTVTIQAGGLAYSTQVTVRAGSVLRPCGTMPLSPEHLPSVRQAQTPAAPPPPPSSPPVEQNPTPTPPPPPAPVPVVAPPAVRPVLRPRPAPPRPRPAREPPPSPVPQAPALPGLVPLAPLPPPPPVARPIPPSGTAPVSVSVPVAQPVAQVERQREEEEALEQSQAYARVGPEHRPGRAAAPLLALILLAAAGGAAIRRPRREQRRGYAFARSGSRRAPTLSRERSRRFR